MFRKIHSKRDPNVALVSELKKEFGHYFCKAETFISAFLSRYPGPVFSVMILAMLLSVGLSFTVFRNREQKVRVKQSAGNARGATGCGGFAQILEAGLELKQTLMLKKQVDSILAKGSLNKADSAALEKALERLQTWNKSLKALK
jgi:hypothetical protein